MGLHVSLGRADSLRNRGILKNCRDILRGLEALQFPSPLFRRHKGDASRRVSTKSRGSYSTARIFVCACRKILATCLEVA